MSMNFPWYRAWGRKRHAKRFGPGGRVQGALNQSRVTSAALRPSEHLSIQLPQGPKGRVWEISSTLCPGWDLDSHAAYRPQGRAEPACSGLTSGHCLPSTPACRPLLSPGCAHRHREVWPHSSRCSPDSLALGAAAQAAKNNADAADGGLAGQW